MRGGGGYAPPRNEGEDMTRGVLGRKGLSSFEIGGTSSNEVEETNKKLLTCGDRKSFAHLT